MATPASGPYLPPCAIACIAALVSSKFKLASFAETPACTKASLICGISAAPSLAPAAITLIILRDSSAAFTGFFKST